MTNKEAIMILESVQPSCEKYSYSESEIYEAIDMAIQALSGSERKTGRWINKGVISDGGVIGEWQECQCSECKRWDTRPYMYNFDEPMFCSFCGAKMRGKQDDKCRQV